MINTCVVTFIYPGIELKIKKFFRSIKNQTDQNFDIIIFLNNLKKLKKIKIKQKIKLIKLNSSIIQSRFEMLKNLKKIPYKYIVFQDADDTMSKNRIKKIKIELKKNHVVVNDLDIISKKKIKKYFSHRIKNNSIVTAKNILDYNFMGMSNTALRKKCLDKTIIPKTLKIKIFDWYFWTIILSKFKAKFINSTTTQYFVRPGSLTCLPTKLNKANYYKINPVINSHKNVIKNLIKKKIIKNIKVSNKAKIVNNIKAYNFWWEATNVQK